MVKPGLDSFHYLLRDHLEIETSYLESFEVDLRSVDDCFAEDEGLFRTHSSITIKVGLLDGDHGLGEDIRSRQVKFVNQQSLEFEISADHGEADGVNLLRGEDRFMIQPEARKFP